MENRNVFRVSIDRSNHIPSIVLDYIKGNNWFSSEKLKSDFLIKAKEKLFSDEKRENLHSVLQANYKNIGLSEKQKRNLNQLKNTTTYTVCTGHQLNFFLGPIYTFYKSIQIIKICEELNEEQKDFFFVPIFWMASEDHDLEEVNHFFYKSKKIGWDTQQKGAVGTMNVENQQKILLDFVENEIELLQLKTELNELIKTIFLDTETVSTLHFKLLNSIFAERGLLVLEPDNKVFKKQMIQIFEKEIESKVIFDEVNKTTKDWKKKDIQVNPREINLFYLESGKRSRIVQLRDGHYELDDQSIKFTKAELLKEISDFPEKFSPNVLMRIVYQQQILPNVAYIGGGAEAKYWLEMEGVFDKLEMQFPIIIPRNSHVIVNEKWTKKWHKLSFELEDIFKTTLELENLIVENKSELKINFDDYRTQIQAVYSEIETKAKQTDFTLSGLVKAEIKKHNRSFDKMEKRLLKAERRVYLDEISRMNLIKKELFPNGILQERICNFSEFCHSDISTLLNSIEDFTQAFKFDFNFIQS